MVGRMIGSSWGAGLSPVSLKILTFVYILGKMPQ
jgi:hypothetical protein